MSERFTAQEMRDIAAIWEGCKPLSSVPDILRQAAKTEERFASLTEERDKFKSAYIRLTTGGDRTYAELEVELSDAQRRLSAAFAQCDKEVAKLNPNGNIDTRLMDEARIGRIRQALKGEEVVE